MSDPDHPNIAILPAHLSVGVPLLALALEAVVDLGLLPSFPAPLPMVVGLALMALAGLGARAASRAFETAATNIDPRAPALALTRDGPYRLSRNPMYLCMITLQTGAYLAFSLDAGLLLIPPLWAALHFGVVLKEESYLSARFGAPYKAYLAQTRRWI